MQKPPRTFRRDKVAEHLPHTGIGRAGITHFGMIGGAVPVRAQMGMAAKGHISAPEPSGLS